MRAAFKIPRTSSSYRMISWGFLRFEVRVHKYTFLFVGTHFKTGWDSKGTAVPLALGHPIGARSAPLDGDSKGDSVPLAGGIQWRAAPLSGRKNPMKPAVSASSRTRNPGVCFSRIRLFGCRWCCEMERKSAAEPWNGATSPGEPKGYVLRKPPYQDGYFLKKTMPGSHVV